MTYGDDRPVIVRTTYKDRKSHYVMTAAEAGTAVAKSMRYGNIIGVEVIPVDQVSTGVKGDD